ncbi:hypothetical protein HDG34_003279 [Paraburkholderia sp. HC6.4b]|uniref:SET domain-containing protein n=1 Tax=unclassified Paraburkholderia TaxID=2615204 RepID=UPI00160F6216|nr:MULTISPECIES: SET domain-containing protein [unclassified Paraburkholderia]MBB5409338.1 hypothetical protein [Paraburkholderia sp. HC6.4b]MBB5451066.1 hypothetical protein [Paraburkholderia sp. Kb1A]
MKRVTVRRSSIHGKGVFALRPLITGERILEYKGLVTTWKEASRHQHEGHTFLFGRSDGRVIDGGRGGNATRWLNHSCAANCEAIEEEGGRVYIEATRDIDPGEELFINYALEVDAGLDEATLAEYACRCGGDDCRGTMLGEQTR